MCATPAATASCSQCGTFSLGWKLATTAINSGARSGLADGLSSPVASAIASPSRTRSWPRSSISRQGRSEEWSATRPAALTSGSSSARVGASSVTFDHERRLRTAASAGPVR
ncbi:MAG: hypothetical protein VB093_08330 [Propionicimonas sp.]|nr:hypothetical protein [Propionicimonas sp.]